MGKGGASESDTFWERLGIVIAALPPVGRRAEDGGRLSGPLLDAPWAWTVQIVSALLIRIQLFQL
jgi:hypothetical protein